MQPKFTKQEYFKVDIDLGSPPLFSSKGIFSSINCNSIDSDSDNSPLPCNRNALLYSSKAISS